MKFTNYYFSLYALLVILPVCLPQLFQNFPYFRGFLSIFSNYNGNPEFQPFSPAASKPLVTTQDGILQGFTLKTVDGRNVSAFQSIPYAEPPVGSLRFRDPMKNKPWNGVRKAVSRSPQCIQLDLVQALLVHGQEDCLYISVYAPQDHSKQGEKFPVMVWIHGGFFFFGAGSLYGPRYLLDHDVILVTINYRLGPFGFLSTGDDASSGNQGLKDQVLALKWVRDNISAFGGDPESVTIFGESAGAASVSLHILSPASRGLFHRAIAQSGSAFCPMASIPDASGIAKKVGKLYNCPTKSSDEMVECLRNVPDYLLANVQVKLAKWLVFPMLWFGPTVEHDHPGAFIKKLPQKYYEDGEAANVPVMTGLTTDELSLLTAVLFKSPVHISTLNGNWSWVGKNILEYPSDELNTTVLNWKVENIREFYMGNKPLNWGTRMNFSRMLSDRHFTICTLDGIKYHSEFTSAPVYAYHFSYQGRYGGVQHVGALTKNWGVGHADDLIYLLNSPTYYNSLEKTDPEMEMSRVMTSIWTTFAIFGHPSVHNDSEIWHPVPFDRNNFSSLRFLELNLNPKIITDLYETRYTFWKHLGTS